MRNAQVIAPESQNQKLLVLVVVAPPELAYSNLETALEG